MFCFRPNTKIEKSAHELSPQSTSNRPDCKISEMRGIHFGVSQRFGEVKRESKCSEKYMLAKDPLPLGVLGRIAWIWICFGHTIPFNVITLIGDGLYAMIEMETVIFPRTLKEMMMITLLQNPTQHNNLFLEENYYMRRLHTSHLSTSLRV
ncbi:hypothetical protein BDA99DRAFT_543411 [Phascolomyces articulosus]|uniref:Uncharacterized protein n=1 Tax=Phascolomyces articulosus TaxID=60185 RepID=A0AAD5JN40_9FUNG|nr:hypothetical protein BDA99DRAFT_543411 [Phascolomyces articulosus]